MKLMAAVQLLPTSAQAVFLLATLARCNEAASWLAIEGHAASTYRQYDLHVVRPVVETADCANQAAKGRLAGGH